MTVTADRSPSPGDLFFDLAERGVLLVLAATAIIRLAPFISQSPHVMLLLISEGLAVAFILLRRRAVRSDRSPYAACIALLGTAAPLLVQASNHAVIPPVAGLSLMIAGLMLNISAKVSLNRSFGLAAANRGIKRIGPYRLLRHPMYAGYVTTQAAFLLLNPSLWNMAIYAVAWSMQLLRIGTEEKLLLEDPDYRAYAEKVHYRLLPGVY